MYTVLDDTIDLDNMIVMINIEGELKQYKLYENSKGVYFILNKIREYILVPVEES